MRGGVTRKKLLTRRKVADLTREIGLRTCAADGTSRHGIGRGVVGVARGRSAPKLLPDLRQPARGRRELLHGVRPFRFFLRSPSPFSFPSEGSSGPEQD